MQSARRPAQTDDALFYPAGDGMAPFRGLGRPQAFAAKVVYVWDDGTVNLVTWDHSGMEHRRLNVPVVTPEDRAPAGSYCMLCAPRVMALPMKGEAT